MELLTALVVMVVLAITPAVMFLCFWEFLVFLRDDALIGELRLEHDIDPAELTGFTVFSASSPARGRSPTDRCPSCGVQTVADYDACPACGEPLE